MSKSKHLSRYISALIMIATIFPAFFITRYCGEVGRYIGSSIYMLVGTWGLFEFLTALKFSKFTAMFSAAAAIIPFFLIPYIGAYHEVVADYPNAQTFDVNLDKVLTWIPYVYIVGASIFPAALEWKRIGFTKMGLTRQLGITFAYIITATFFKTLFVTNTTNIATVFYFIGIAILADTMGFFGGMLFGKKWFKGKKLAPKISPKKTWAGAVVGFASSTLFAIILGYYGHIWESIPMNEWAISIIMAVVLSIISPIGDLAFSAMKRQENIKDFSDLIPGHGGIFDRIDAMSLVTFVSAMIFIAIK